VSSLLPIWRNYRSTLIAGNANECDGSSAEFCRFPHIEIAAGLTEPLLTCEAVLAETAFQLESTAVALAMVNEGLVALAFECHKHLAQLQRSVTDDATQRRRLRSDVKQSPPAAK
jgi:hypothetical protein